jgi:hypothetical protein
LRRGNGTGRKPYPKIFILESLTDNQDNLRNAKMSTKTSILIFFVIVFLLEIQTVSINAKDDSTIEIETVIINSLPHDGISFNDMHLIRPGTTLISIRSSIQGYEVYVDGYLSDIEGRTEPLDGQITIRVDGDLSHTIKIVKETYFNEITRYFEMDKSYTINL